MLLKVLDLFLTVTFNVGYLLIGVALSIIVPLGAIPLNSMIFLAAGVMFVVIAIIFSIIKIIYLDVNADP